MPESQQQAAALSAECAALTIIATAKGIEAANAMQAAINKCEEADACWEAILNGEEDLPEGMVMEEVQRNSRVCKRNVRLMKAIVDAQNELTVRIA